MFEAKELLFRGNLLAIVMVPGVSTRTSSKNAIVWRGGCEILRALLWFPDTRAPYFIVEKGAFDIIAF